MMEALSALPQDELHVQHGPADPPLCAGAYDYLPFNRMVELIEQTDVVVSHAGVGSIICALRAGHVPIVFPRLKRFDETVDDHQAELAEALERRGNVIVVWNADELVEAIASIPPRGAAHQLGAEVLCGAVGAAIRAQPHQAHVTSRRLWRGFVTRPTAARQTAHSAHPIER
jgi:UDP-N-acetylglucosamine transferase subunit ALG13